MRKRSRRARSVSPVRGSARSASRRLRADAPRARGGPPFSSLKNAPVGHDEAVDGVRRPGGPPVHDADAEPLLGRDVPAGLRAAQRRRRGLRRVRRNRSVARRIGARERYLVAQRSASACASPPGAARPSSWIPCASGPRPVARVVQTMAGTCSGSTRRPAAGAARRSIADRRGISPCAASICPTIRRSSPSMPSTRTRTPVGTTAKSGAARPSRPLERYDGGGDGGAEQQRGRRQQRQAGACGSGSPRAAERPGRPRPAPPPRPAIPKRPSTDAAPTPSSDGPATWNSERRLRSRATRHHSARYRSPPAPARGPRCAPARAAPAVRRAVPTTRRPARPGRRRRRSRGRAP